MGTPCGNCLSRPPCTWSASGGRNGSGFSWRQQTHMIDPIPQLPLQPIDSVSRTGNYGSIRSLAEAENVAAVEAGADLAPGQAAILADEDPAPLLIVHYAT